MIAVNEWIPYIFFVIFLLCTLSFGVVYIKTISEWSMIVLIISGFLCFISFIWFVYLLLYRSNKIMKGLEKELMIEEYGDD